MSSLKNNRRSLAELADNLNQIVYHLENAYVYFLLNIGPMRHAGTRGLDDDDDDW